MMRAIGRLITGTRCCYPSVVAPPTLIDPATIASLRALNSDGDDFLREIVGLFAADVPARLAEFDQGLASGDRVRCHRAAHSIKGSSANIGASLLREAAARLEERVEGFGLDGVGPLLAEVRVEAARAQSELAAILAGEPRSS
jgi:HPt (histidine-containing phosphotransfer) domain-containing protein